MKKSEAGLFVIVSSFFFIFLAYVATVSLQQYSFSDPIIKKYLLLIFFLLAIQLTGLFLNSLSKSFILFLPLLFQFNRQLIPFSSFLRLPPALATDGIDIVQTIIIFLFIIFFNVKKILHYFYFKPIRFYMVFITVGLISIIWAFNRNSSVSFLFNIFMLPFSYYVFSRLFEFDEKNILYLSLGLVLTGLISILFVWPNYFGIKGFSSLIASNNNPGQASDSIRAGGVISRAGIAMLLASIIPYIYSFGIFYFSKYKKTVNLIGLILILTLVMTLNRMHFLATCCSIALIIWFGIKEKNMKINLSYFFSGVIIFIVGIYYVISKNTATVEDIVYRTTYESRFQQYQAAYANLKYSFGLGIGMNNFLVSPITASVLGLNSWSLRTGNTVHNDLLRISSEYGILGLIYFVLSFSFLFTTRSNLSISKALIRGSKINIICLLIIGLTTPAFNNVTVLIISGLYMAIIKYYSSSNEGKLLNELKYKYCIPVH